MADIASNVPETKLTGILPVIASSPTYMEAVFATIESESNASRDEIENAKDIFDQFIAGMINGEVDSDSARNVLTQIVEPGVEKPKLASTITPTLLARVVATARQATNSCENAGYKRSCTE